jgi:hypothetical protein
MIYFDQETRAFTGGATLTKEAFGNHKLSGTKLADQYSKNRALALKGRTASQLIKMRNPQISGYNITDSRKAFINSALAKRNSNLTKLGIPMPSNATKI